MVKKNILKILAIIGAAIILGELVFIGVNLLSRGKADKALSSGVVEITSAKKLDDYFVSLPVEKVKVLLKEKEGKLLFPQFDLAMADGEKMVVKETDGNINGAAAKFVTINGLPSGTKIYSATGGFVRGGTALSGIYPYAWAEEIWPDSDNADIMRIYFPATDTGGVENPVFSIDMDPEVFSSVELGEQFAVVLTTNPVPENLVAGGASIAAAIAGEDGVFTKFSLSNILTFRGKIVMIEK